MKMEKQIRNDSRSAVWYRNGRPMRESSETDKESEAKKLLKLRQGDIARGVPVTPRIDRVTFLGTR
jgi:hypothetical protein